MTEPVALRPCGARPVADVRAALAALAIVAAAAASGCGGAPAGGPIRAVGVESQYADVISQIGGSFVSVVAIERKPDIDPHSFEASPAIARELASANLVVENGLGYDAWVDKVLAATAGGRRSVIDAQHVMRLPDSTVNPHLWYAPQTMPVVAQAIANVLATLEPDDAAYFHANVRRFDASLGPWKAALAGISRRFKGTPVAVTEPVADYLLDEAGLRIATPKSLELAIMNGTDPAPQDIAGENALLSGRVVKAFVYNRQVTSPLTQAFLARARRAGIPVIGVYETMPEGDRYQDWMLATTRALSAALSRGASTRSQTR
jgi:zinc/manganese transport system substrate-binding protein